jgi:molecular chaperone GrpE
MSNKWKDIAKEGDQDVDDQDANSPPSEQPTAPEQGKLSLTTREELEAELTKAEQLVEKYKQDLLRTQADLENVRRRFSQELENAHKFGIEKFAKEALPPIIDSLEASLQKMPEAKAADMDKIKEGLELTLKHALSVLKKFGMEQVNPAGQVFNPTLHQAMSMVASQTVPGNHVVEVLQKGYTLHGRLVRPALVVVAK